MSEEIVNATGPATDSHFNDIENNNSNIGEEEDRESVLSTVDSTVNSNLSEFYISSDAETEKMDNNGNGDNGDNVSIDEPPKLSDLIPQDNEDILHVNKRSIDNVEADDKGEQGDIVKTNGTSSKKLKLNESDQTGSEIEVKDGQEKSKLNGDDESNIKPVLEETNHKNEQTGNLSVEQDSDTQPIESKNNEIHFNVTEENKIPTVDFSTEELEAVDKENNMEDSVVAEENSKANIENHDELDQNQDQDHDQAQAQDNIDGDDEDAEVEDVEDDEENLENNNSINDEEIDGSDLGLKNNTADDNENISPMELEEIRLSALKEITDIEYKFAELRQRLYENKLVRLQTELQMCLEGSHPELQKYYTKIASIRDYKLHRTYIQQKYELKCIDQQTRATRTSIHQDFYKKSIDLRNKLLNDTTQQWYDINKERRDMDITVPVINYHVPVKIAGKTLSCITGYAGPAQQRYSGEELLEDYESENINFRYRSNPVDKLEVIVDRMRTNNELSDLNGLKKYYNGFPGAPDLNGLKDIEVLDDLQRIRQSLNQHPEELHYVP